MMQSNESVARHVRAHHEELVSTLAAKAAALNGPAADGARDALLSYVQEEILPHALFEEKTLYREASKRNELRVLIDSLLYEHHEIKALTSEVQKAPDASSAAAYALSLAILFKVHAAKENDFVLPALTSDPSVNLGRLLDDEAQADIELDVRALPHARRHETIFALLERLVPGQALVITNDHDPQPLKYQISSMWRGLYEWTYLEAGPHTWRVAIRRAQASQDA